MSPDGQRKIALVTGAGSGVGRAAALALGRAGWTMVLAGRRPEPLRAVADELGPERPSLCVPTDVSRSDHVVALFAAIRERFGRLDLLFNNAGGWTPGRLIDDIDDETWAAAVGVNLTGAFYCAREAFRLMRTQNPMGGRIINNGSVSAHAPRPRSVPYTATKHAITGLTKTLSLDGRAFDIACGQIDIGNAATPMMEVIKDGALQADGAVRLEPMMAAEQAGEAVVFMAALPPGANVQFMTVTATKMPFIGRG